MENSIHLEASEAAPAIKLQPNTKAGELTDLQKALDQFDFVRFSVVDIHGITRSRTVCRPGFTNSFRDGTAIVLTSIGIGIGANPNAALKFYSELPETRSRADGNVMILPIPRSLHPLPACSEGKYRVGQVFCETFYPWNNQHQQECPRYVARKQLNLLNSMGFQLYSGIELEFFLFDPKSMKPVVTEEKEYLSGLTFTKFQSVLLESCSILNTMGVDIECTHVEAASGQFELILAPQIGIQAADNAFLAKDCVKEVARKHGLTAVFLTKSHPEQFCNTAHFNHSLKSIKSGENAFSDKKNQQLLSSEFRAWMGGLVQHFRAVSAICMPTNNCRRLEEFYTPMQSDWGIDDRNAAYRVKSDNPSRTYIENRISTGSANYYLVMAATVAAGMDGISQQLPCPLPINKGIQVSKEHGLEIYQYVKASKMNESFKIGLDSLQQDQVMVEALGESLIQLFVNLKEDEMRTIEECCSDTMDGPEREVAMYEKGKELYMYLL